MEEMKINGRPTTIVTGKPNFYGSDHTITNKSGTSQNNTFQSVLQQEFKKSQQISFSKHAAERVETRGIELSENHLGRLNEGVRLAEQKGLDDTLILMDKTAFVVSVRNKTVITAVNGNDLTGNVFTNIDGTVIV